MSYIIKAVLANPNIPENGVASIPFPLSGVEYDHSICEVLEPMGHKIDDHEDYKMQ